MAVSAALRQPITNQFAWHPPWNATLSQTIGANAATEVFCPLFEASQPPLITAPTKQRRSRILGIAVDGLFFFGQKKNTRRETRIRLPVSRSMQRIRKKPARLTLSVEPRFIEA
jgi:hypothetical protein